MGKNYEISNVRSGVLLGCYNAEDEAEALAKYANDAGYESFESACRDSGTKASDVRAEVIDGAI